MSFFGFLETVKNPDAAIDVQKKKTKAGKSADTENLPAIKLLKLKYVSPMFR